MPRRARHICRVSASRLAFACNSRALRRHIMSPQVWQRKPYIVTTNLPFCMLNIPCCCALVAARMYRIVRARAAYSTYSWLRAYYSSLLSWFLRALCNHWPTHDVPFCTIVAGTLCVTAHRHMLPKQERHYATAADVTNRDWLYLNIVYGVCFGLGLVSYWRFGVALQDVGRNDAVMARLRQQRARQIL